MTSQTNELAVEIAIENQLTGTCLETQKGVAEVGDLLFSPNHGYQLGLTQDFNARYAIDSKRFWAFLEHTQYEELDVQDKILQAMQSRKKWMASSTAKRRSMVLPKTKPAIISIKTSTAC